MKTHQRRGRLQTSLSSFITLIAITSHLSSAAPSLTDDSKCECYLTNGTQATFFATHKFLDFRNLAKHASVPPTIAKPDESGRAPVTSEYFTSKEWTETFWVQSWNNSHQIREDATVLMVNSPNNVYIEANGDRNPSSQTWLTLRTQRLKDFQTASEIESVAPGFKYLSVRMLARTVGAPGAITALFTYRGSDRLADVQESDLEVRTMDPRNTIQYTNQPSYTEDGDDIEGATMNVTLPNGHPDWTHWAVHRLDWTPKETVWYVDGTEVATISFQAPRDPSKVILNAWSDGGEWSGNMTVNEAAYLQIQWLEIVYNATDENPAKRKRDGDLGAGVLMPRDDEEDGEESCDVVCSIDETPERGRPVMLWNNAGVRLMEVGLVPWMVPSLAVLGMFALSSGGLFW
ncbi:concanavalin A-like lectin/glucanase domain-containing protein [Sordaria brevicollis]|uniref:Concanavalin A-like lectin/glucanase domain-containing protein n=1 Tax=Sordaria brevicollis TaxID=83679 RepID=A0AAE0NVH5_SORBR|nr:concanavalin A-like lectin/glucanase domain-containing protein [Sordaria brevicollis]